MDVADTCGSEEQQSRQQKEQLPPPFTSMIVLVKRLFHGQLHCAAMRTSQKLGHNLHDHCSPDEHCIQMHLIQSTRAARTAGVQPLVAITRGSGTDARANVSSSLTSEPRSWTSTLSVSSMLPNASSNERELNTFKIRDASPDRQPKIQSSSVEETLQRIMGQTNNDCRFRIFTLTSSLHQQHLLVAR